jgi:hypothetical protein
MQFQPKLRETLSKRGQEPVGIFLILETHSKVVSETNDDHIPVRKATSPPLNPLIEDVM